jgi:hypothetical protein
MNTIEVFKIILNACEAAACVTGFVNWNKIKNTYWKWLPFYLALIVAAEFMGKYFTYRHMDEPKEIMYNYIVIPMEILFFLYMFYNEFKHTRSAGLPVYCMVIYVLCFLADNFYLSNKYKWFLSFSYTTGVILLVVNILIFLFRLVISSRILFFRTNFMFWICIGLLLFYLGGLPFYIIINTLYEYNKPFMNFAYIMYVFDWLMYLSFIIAFIWGKMKSQDL